jgi:hypothetical protein
MKNISTITIQGDSVLITYKNEINESKGLTIVKSELSSDSLNALTTLAAEIQSKIEILPKVTAKVTNCTLIDGKFIIQGEILPVKRANVSDLSNSTLVTGTTLTQVQVYNALAAFVLSMTGQELTSIIAPFNTGKIVVNNGDVMNYSTLLGINSTVMRNASMLVIDLFNS